MKGKKNRSAGGSSGREHMKVSGNPDVFKEAAKKDGGRVKQRAAGGKVPELMTGGAVRPRLDRPGRKTGGRVGADKSPLSSAHSGSHGSEATPKSADSYGGLRPD